MKAQNYIRRFALVVCLGSSIVSARADSILSQGDEAVLSPPVADFRTELDRLKSSPEFEAVPTSFDSPDIQAEVEDLRSALKKAGKSDDDIEQIATAHLAERRKLLNYDEQMERSDVESLLTSSPAPGFPHINYTDGLPPEFADYLEGSLAWHNPSFDKSVARPAWERILNRPADERRYKSTWAAYMIGRSWEKEDPEKAIQYYEQVRTLARAGFSDRIGLAASSLGLEARVYLNQTNYVRAIDLYLRQLATGENSAYASLMFTMRALFRGGGTESFPALAKDAHARRVVTAYIIATKALQVSLACGYPDTEEASNHIHDVVHAWLTTAEPQAAKDSVELREEFALAAYQNGDWELAQRWIDRSGGSAVAQWLQAKLLFRAKRISQAGALLARIQPLFPLEREDTNAPFELKDNLTSMIPMWDTLNAEREVRAELGVFYVSRGDYADALTQFLDAKLWSDSAYLAERVMTLNELKSYVDTYVPLTNDVTSESSEPVDRYYESYSYRLRHLLARRLMRDLRGNEARSYYPPSVRGDFDELAKGLSDGWNESNPPEERAKALFAAAQIANTNGFELLSTEVGPDWHVSDCESEGTLSAETRTNGSFTLLPATADELRRYDESKPDPNKRYHYRYQAAGLAWEAAKLMPNGSNETAQVLCIAGSWIKYMDPQTADLFYKSLVRRCGKTELGHEADVRRWFPSLDGEGNIIPRDPPHHSEPEMESESGDLSQTDDNDNDNGVEATPAPPLSAAGDYIIQAGDSLGMVAKKTGVTVRQILDANPGLEGARIKIGQRIAIPIRVID